MKALTQPCHAGDGLDAMYDKKSGTLELRCWTCGALTLIVKVAGEPATS
jgi:hypothetical protein